MELHNSRHPLKPLYGSTGFARTAHSGTRFSRVYVGEKNGVPFLSSSDIIGLRPERGNYLSRKHTPKLAVLLIEPWMVLLSRSGTIGNAGLASPRMAGWALSEDAIRIVADTPASAGFITAFLRSPWGRKQLKGLTYGSVIQHIEPHHLTSVSVPVFSEKVTIAIGQAFVDAALKRDEANKKLDEADTKLRTVLGLPALPSHAGGPIVGRVRASELGGRLDASFHSPIARWVERELSKRGFVTESLTSPKFTRKVFAITKFRKRVYVEKGGIPLLSSKQLFQIDPIERNRLARGAHQDDLKEIALAANMIAITCSGTTGRVQIVPEYMAGWAANEHTSRIVTVDEETAGFLYCWLNSLYGQVLLNRHYYGSVILELDRRLDSGIPVPLLPKANVRRLGRIVLEGNRLRSEAWALEQGALETLSKQIPGA